MTDTEREPGPVRIVVDHFEGNGQGVADFLVANLILNGEHTHTVTFTLGHLDYMQTEAETTEQVDDLWDRAIEEMAGRLAAELTHSGLMRFQDPINVQSHLASFTAPHRSGLREPGTVLVEFKV